MADVNGDHLEPSLRDVICALTKSMQGFSTAIDEVKQVVKDLSDSIEGLPKGIGEAERKVIEGEEAWEIVRDTGKEQQKETVDSWKDELNNLLVFAGLFSAVVTAFTIESYTWLQQDPGDASNALLAQLSHQLSMFMITFSGSPPSSAFANSTTPALSLSDVESSFSPVSYAVSVNTLWVLSLTLSLISAFFAIAAQQWLRQLHLPPEMPVRRAVQLLEARKDGLKTWQVPSIIALLPLLLQIAVIFFLVGLFLLLRSLNNTVAIAFGSVAAVGLLAFLAATITPLFTHHCPYKSPLVPTVAFVLQCLSYPLTVISAPFVLFFVICIGVIEECIIDHSVLDLSDIVDFLRKNALTSYIRSFGRHMFVDMSQFWLTREYKYTLSRDKDGADPSNTDLECSSRIQTFLSTPARSSSKVPQQLNGSEGNTSVRGVQDTVVSSLRAFRTGLKWSDLIPLYKLDPKMAPYIGQWFSARHHRLLWQYLQQRDWKRDREVTPDDGRCLTVFHELDNTFPATRQRYAKHLLQICAQQELWYFSEAEETVPACLVLDLIVNRGYVPDEGDAGALLGFISKVYDKYRRPLWLYRAYRFFLVSAALALIAVNKSGAVHLASMTSTANILAGALDDETTKEKVVGQLQTYYQDVDGWSRIHPEYMSPARIMEILCEALSNYAASPLLTPSPGHLDDLTRISASLLEMCTGGDPSYALAEQSEMQAAYRSLDDLNNQIKLITTRKAVTAGSATRAVARTQALHPDPSGAHASGSVSGDHTAPTTLQETKPNNEASPSDSATRTAQIDAVQGNPTVTDKEQGRPLAAASTGQSDLSYPIGNDAAAGSTASVGAQTTPCTSDKGKERETPAIPLPTPKPREGQEPQDVNETPALNGASGSMEGPKGPSASEMDHAAAEDDAPHDEGPNNMDLGGPDGDVTGIRGTGGE